MAIWHRTETAADDDARSGRLMDGVDTVYAARTDNGATGDDLDDFEETVLFAASPEPGTPYPPPGHGYPRR